MTLNLGNYYCPHLTPSELEPWLRDEVGGETQRYIYTTFISSGFKTTDLVERKPLKDFEQENDTIRFALGKIIEAAILGKAGG